MDTLTKTSTKKVITLDAYLSEASQHLSYGKTLSCLLVHIAESTKKIAALAAQGALADADQKLDTTNVQGEVQTSIDVLSNDIFIAGLKNSGLVCGLVSEELESPLLFTEADKAGKFLVAFDPLDGSSNVGVNVSTGSIFSILTACKDTNNQYDFLQPGNKQLAAGYVLYGPSTMLVITIGSGVNGFTLCPESNTFLLTHPNIQIPETASEYAINASNERYWEEPVQQYMYACIDGKDGKRGRDFNMRWVASMVADIHRILMRGGIYLYPADHNPQTIKSGRIRLLYEANPMSYIVEQAGGKCTAGRQRILDIQPVGIHQRTPVFLGSSTEVTFIELFHNEFDSTLADARLQHHLEYR